VALQIKHVHLGFPNCCEYTSGSLVLWYRSLQAPKKPSRLATIILKGPVQPAYPGVAIREDGAEAHLVIPGRFRVGHEAHFAQVTNQFFDCLKTPQSAPAWEKTNMLVKYFITTRGVEAGK
jgi:hypothetical protein